MDTRACATHILLLAGMSWLCQRTELAGSRMNVLVKDSMQPSSTLLFYGLYLSRLSSALTAASQCFVEHGWGGGEKKKTQELASGCRGVHTDLRYKGQESDFSSRFLTAIHSLLIVPCRFVKAESGQRNRNV